MMIHHFNSETGEYVSSSLALPDPRNEKRWLMPAFSTDTPLPDRSRHTWPFWRDGAWTLLPDYRGRVLYRTSNGEPAEISRAGVTPEETGLTEKARPSDEYVWNDGDWAVDPQIVAAAKRKLAMEDFEKRYAEAQRQTLGKESAVAAGLLDDLATATFRAWSAYQMQLVDVINGSAFPDRCDWPDKPTADSIEQIRGEIEAEKARIAEGQARIDASKEKAESKPTAGDSSKDDARQTDDASEPSVKSTEKEPAQ
ncbi:tail fiber assembly protein [Burkholderia plantarii]|uniref:Phage tail assembly chaperone gp38 n=1 Tax=Burkholderia plantarii TaxID=41899 RepID=A0A0B6RLR0_BURPL|nr:tail assembly chaperone [Burkholderia plantarii]AJK46257.1 phage tail assembly chaperone gp38 [Burkholderia plantarii]ALK30826.1 caudovirales tail fiber assembly protein [Burkholderia plantarii]GLZ19455.1 hypothetical protein Bpla01_29850 [Burkholderia plantarii]